MSADAANGRPGPRALGRGWTSLAAIGFAVAAFAADQWELDDRIRWAVALGAAIALAATLRWSRRQRRWFWPAVAVLVSAAAAIALAAPWPAGPDAGGREWVFLILFPAVVAAAWLFWMEWLFEPHVRTRSSIAAEIVLYGFAIVVIALIGFLIWVASDAAGQDKRLSQLVLTEKSRASVGRLTYCLMLPRDRAVWWRDLPGGGQRLYDMGSGLGISVIDRGTERVIEVTTKRGRPLRKAETERVARCID